MNRQLFCYNSLKRLRLKELSLFVLAAATFSIPASCSNKASNNIKDNSSANTEQTTETQKCQGNLVMKAGKCVAAEAKNNTVLADPDDNTSGNTTGTSGRTATGNSNATGNTHRKLQWMGSAGRNTFTVDVDTSSIRELIADHEENDDDSYTNISFKFSGGWQIEEILEDEEDEDSGKPKLKTIGTLHRLGGKKTPTYLSDCSPEKKKPEPTRGAKITVSNNNRLVINFGSKVDGESNSYDFWTSTENGRVVIPGSAKASLLIEHDNLKSLKYQSFALKPEHVSEGPFSGTAREGTRKKKLSGSTTQSNGCFKFLYANQDNDYQAIPSEKRGILIDTLRGQTGGLLSTNGNQLPSDASISASDDEDATYKLEAFVDDDLVATIDGGALKYFLYSLYEPWAGYIKEGDPQGDEDEFMEQIEELIAAIAEDLDED